VLGQALELEFGADLTIGPALTEGFYYDCYLGDRSLGDAERERILRRMQSTVKARQTFERVVITKNEALDMFAENQFKVEMITAFPPDEVRAPVLQVARFLASEPNPTRALDVFLCFGALHCTRTALLLVSCAPFRF
jgi:threonyl-tRNA synthetase